jgi:hypothetical protein
MKAARFLESSAIRAFFAVDGCELLKLKQSVDKRCDRRTLGEEDQNSENQKNKEHRREPPPLVLPEK